MSKSLLGLYSYPAQQEVCLCRISIKEFRIWPSLWNKLSCAHCILCVVSLYLRTLPCTVSHPLCSPLRSYASSSKMVLPFGCSKALLRNRYYLDIKPALSMKNMNYATAKQKSRQRCV